MEEKLMKKALSILLALVMVLSLFACNSTPAPAPTPTPDSSTPNNPAPPDGGGTANTPGAAALNGFYDFEYDYSANKRLKLAYLITTNGVLYETASQAMKIWADRINCDLDVVDSNGDNDLYISNIETLKNQGYDGLILDPDITLYQVISEKCAEVGMAWMPSMGAPRSEDMKLLHPCAGFDDYYQGTMMMDWLLDYQKTNWPQAQTSEIGVISIDFSSSWPIHERTRGAQDTWNKLFPDLTGNFLIADCITGNLDSTTAYNLVGAMMPTQPKIKYWLIAAAIDDLADGAASAAIDSSLSDNAVVITCGGPGLILQWDSGEETPWKAALYSAPMLCVEPLVCGLYAYVMGWQTPDTLWAPEWVNKSVGEKYAFLMQSTFIMTKDNYREYMEWVDLYTGVDVSSYPVTPELGDFEGRGGPPDYYAG
jgi:ABC-type sugar transport system substrate-binding protein